MVFGKQFKRRPDIPNDVPLEHYWQRLSQLVDQGQVEGRWCMDTFAHSKTKDLCGTTADAGRTYCPFGG